MTSSMLAKIFEIGMVICFGASWPFNVVRCYKARTAKGTSIGFLCLGATGYVSAIISKFVNKQFMADFSSNWYVLFFYVLNLFMILLDIAIYFRNCKIDKKNEVL